MRHFQTDYNIEPRFLNKMLKEFKRRGLVWQQSGWIDGEMEGALAGSREDLIDFVVSATKRLNHKTKRWRKITREEAAKQIQPIQEEEPYNDDPNPYPSWHPGH
jgi:hypothetical protein